MNETETKWLLFGPCEDAINGDEPPTFHSQCMQAFHKDGALVMGCTCTCHEWDAGEEPDDNINVMD